MEQLASVRPAAEQPKGFFLGLAFGQAADYTALVVNERMGHTPPDHMGVLKRLGRSARNT